MLGTVPKDKEVYKSYIASKAATLENGIEEVGTVEEIEAKGWTGFHRDEKGYFIYDYMIRGFLKEAGNTLKEAVKVKNLKSKIDRYVFIYPRRIFLAAETDGHLERPLRAMTMQGPRVTLARSDYVKEGTVIRFQVKLLENKEITMDLIKELLEYGQFQGLGQFRNGSYGRFVFEVA
jgi:hypothetical protein